MYEIVKDFPNEFIFAEGHPCISIYQLTHRHAPENMEDGTAFKNTINKIEESLLSNYDKPTVAAIMEPLEELLENRHFWNNTLDGIGVFANKNKCIVYVLPRPVENSAMIGDRFVIRPLLRTFQSAANYHILGLNKDSFTLFTANRYAIEEIEKDPEIFKTLKDVLGDEFTDSFLNYGSYGGTPGNAMYHGQGSKTEEGQKDLVKYFRYVDKAVLDNFSKNDKLPMILVALAQNGGEFRKISANPHLMKQGIDAAVESFDLVSLKEKAWAIMEPAYLEKTEVLVEEFHNAKAASLASGDLAQVAKAAVEKRIKTLLVAADTVISGILDRESGEIEPGQSDDLNNNDVIEEIVKLVLKSQGQVVVLPLEKMPDKAAVAAINRF